MADTKVYLIGGAPGAGKTTLGRVLAARLGVSSVSIDDLVTVAQTVTTPETHPGLHVMRAEPHLDYFTYSSPEQLVADADAQHEAAWPFVERVIHKHATWAPPIVIDGWHLRPDKVAGLELPGVWAGWIVATPAVLVEREERNREWLQRSPAPERMLRNFLARSLWFNELVEREAAAHGMAILRQPGDASAGKLCDMIPQA